MEDIPEAAPPTEVELDRERSLRVAWPDGVGVEIPLTDLRLACPCAACRGRREQGLAAWPTGTATGPLTARDAALVGNWGLQVTWDDGHDTGIYPWSLLRACAAEAPDSGS